MAKLKPGSLPRERKPTPSVTNLSDYQKMQIMEKLNIKVSGWKFDNSYSRLSDKLFTRIKPQKVDAPELVLFNEELAREMGLKSSEKQGLNGAEVFSGNAIPPGAEPIAQAYAGHQFGHFTMLGDGRAHLLGEQICPSGKRVDVQLKGSGRTPYSRMGDGRATLYSMLREYLISEALQHLGIPSSRSLAVALTGEQVPRERLHPGAVLTRISSSHIRVGTFEYIRQFVDEDHLKSFFHYTVRRHYPELENGISSQGDNLEIDPEKVLEFVRKVMEKQTDLVVNWMRVGFIHGVMNTDNTTLSGETIDYGPCAFINAYHPETVFSSIDTQGRYSFANQAGIAQWNVGCLAGALLPLMGENQDTALESARDMLSGFPALFRNKWLKMMGQKLGLSNPGKEDGKLISELMDWMEKEQADYTNTFRYLSGREVADETPWNGEEFQKWKKRWETRLRDEAGGKDTALQTMQKSNPNYIPRNHLVEEALEDAGLKADFTKFNHLMEVLKDPYSDQQFNEELNRVPVGWDEGYQTFCGT